MDTLSWLYILPGGHSGPHKALAQKAPFSSDNAWGRIPTPINKTTETIVSWWWWLRTLFRTYIYHKIIQLFLFYGYGEPHECPICSSVQVLNCCHKGRRGSDILAESELKTCIWWKIHLKQKFVTEPLCPLSHARVGMSVFAHGWAFSLVYPYLLSTRILSRHHAPAQHLNEFWHEPGSSCLCRALTTEPVHGPTWPVFSELIFESWVCVWISLNL